MARLSTSSSSSSTLPVPKNRSTRKAAAQQQQQQQQQQQFVDWSSYGNTYKGPSSFETPNASTSWTSSNNKKLDPNAPTWPYATEHHQQQETNYKTLAPTNGSTAAAAAAADKENQRPFQSQSSKAILTTSPDQLTATSSHRSQANSTTAASANATGETSKKASPRSEILTLIGAWGALKAPKSEGESPGKRTFLLEEALSLSTPPAQPKVPKLSSPLTDNRKRLLAHRNAVLGSPAPSALQTLKLGSKAR